MYYFLIGDITVARVLSPNKDGFHILEYLDSNCRCTEREFESLAEIKEFLKLKLKTESTMRVR